MTERERAHARYLRLREMRVDRGCSPSEAANAASLADRLAERFGFGTAQASAPKASNGGRDWQDLFDHLSGRIDADQSSDDDSGADFYLPPFWVTAKGERIPIEDLTDIHLHNILSVLSRQRSGVKSKIRHTSSPLELDQLNSSLRYVEARIRQMRREISRRENLS